MLFENEDNIFVDNAAGRLVNLPHLPRMEFSPGNQKIQLSYSPSDYIRWHTLSLRSSRLHQIGRLFQG